MKSGCFPGRYFSARKAALSCLLHYLASIFVDLRFGFLWDILVECRVSPSHRKTHDAERKQIEVARIDQAIEMSLDLQLISSSSVSVCHQLWYRCCLL